MQCDRLVGKQTFARGETTWITHLTTDCRTDGFATRKVGNALLWRRLVMKWLSGSSGDFFFNTLMVKPSVIYFTQGRPGGFSLSLRVDRYIWVYKQTILKKITTYEKTCTLHIITHWFRAKYIWHVLKNMAFTFCTLEVICGFSNLFRMHTKDNLRMSPNVK